MLSLATVLESFIVDREFSLHLPCNLYIAIVYGIYPID